MKKFLKRIMLIAGTAAVCVAVVFVLMACNVEKILYQPPEPLSGLEYPMLNAGDQQIAYLYLPGAPDSDVILYSHGNAEDLSTVRFTLQELHAAGYGVIGYDYEGYGASSGTPSSENACRDVETVYRYLTENLKISPEKIVIYGFSVGTGASCYLAKKFPAKALILEAPFASAFQVVLPFGGLPGDRLPNADRVAAAEIPLLVFHGNMDLIIPFRNGKKVYEASAAKHKKFVKASGAGHNNIKQKLGSGYWKILREFLENLPPAYK